MWLCFFISVVNPELLKHAVYFWDNHMIVLFSLVCQEFFQVIVNSTACESTVVLIILLLWSIGTNYVIVFL